MTIHGTWDNANRNGADHDLTIDSKTLLIHALRDELEYTGPNVGCESTMCGVCIFDGNPVKSCTLLAIQADESEIMIVEGLANIVDDGLHPLQEAFTEEHGLQCGYCTPGMLMTAVSLIKENPDPTDEEVHHTLEGNLCQCTGCQNIVSAVQVAADRMRTEEPADD